MKHCPAKAHRLLKCSFLKNRRNYYLQSLHNYTFNHPIKLQWEKGFSPLLSEAKNYLAILKAHHLQVQNPSSKKRCFFHLFKGIISVQSASLAIFIHPSALASMCFPTFSLPTNNFQFLSCSTVTTCFTNSAGFQRRNRWNGIIINWNDFFFLFKKTTQFSSVVTLLNMNLQPGRSQIFSWTLMLEILKIVP